MPDAVRSVRRALSVNVAVPAAEERQKVRLRWLDQLGV